MLQDPPALSAKNKDKTLDACFPGVELILEGYNLLLHADGVKTSCQDRNNGPDLFIQLNIALEHIIGLLCLQGAQPSGGSSIDEASQTVRDIARLVGAQPANSVELQLQQINEKMEAVSEGLPEGFLDPLMPEESFNDAQVGSLSAELDSASDKFQLGCTRFHSHA